MPSPQFAGACPTEYMAQAQPSPCVASQLDAELAEAMNMAELSELARDPDIQALLQEG